MPSVILLKFTALDLFPPLYILGVPRNGLLERLLEIRLGLPAQVADF